MVPADRTREALARLPLAALPVDDDTRRFLATLGLSTLADVQRLPRATLGTRLGASVGPVLSFLDGDDRTPLVPYVPPPTPQEASEREYGVAAQEALLFVARGLCHRLGGRLEGRGQGASRLELHFTLDRALLPPGESASFVSSLTLPSPLCRAKDLLAVVRARLERLELPAPTLAVRLRASGLVALAPKTLHLFEPEAKAERALPRLVAELAAEWGEERVGLLALCDTWRLRERAVLVPLGAAPTAPPLSRLLSGAPEPTRLLPAPLPVAPHEVVEPRLVLRLAYTEWWRRGGGPEDYLVGWVPSAASVGLFCKREGGLFLEGWLE